MRDELCMSRGGRLGSGRLSWDGGVAHDGEESLGCYYAPHAMAYEDSVYRWIDGRGRGRGGDLEVDDLVLKPTRVTVISTQSMGSVAGRRRWR